MWYRILRNLYDPKLLECSIPSTTGLYKYNSSDCNNFKYIEVERLVPGSIGRYTHPFFEKAYDQIKIKIEDVLGEKLYKTYYYDRFYFSGQSLKKHTDRRASEIACSIHIGSSIEERWPLWIQTPDGCGVSIDLNPGDGVLYKGIECSHWRDPMPGDGYYHQIVMCFVLSNGEHSMFKGDLGQSRGEWALNR